MTHTPRFQSALSVLLCAFALTACSGGSDLGFAQEEKKPTPTKTQPPGPDGSGLTTGTLPETISSTPGEPGGASTGGVSLGSALQDTPLGAAIEGTPLADAVAMVDAGLSMVTEAVGMVQAMVVESLPSQLSAPVMVVASSPVVAEIPVVGSAVAPSSPGLSATSFKPGVYQGAAGFSGNPEAFAFYSLSPSGELYGFHFVGGAFAGVVNGTLVPNTSDNSFQASDLTAYTFSKGTGSAIVETAPTLGNTFVGGRVNDQGVLLGTLTLTTTGLQSMLQLAPAATRLPSASYSQGVLFSAGFGFPEVNYNDVNGVSATFTPLPAAPGVGMRYNFSVNSSLTRCVINGILAEQPNSNGLFALEGVALVSSVTDVAMGGSPVTCVANGVELVTGVAYVLPTPGAPAKNDVIMTLRSADNARVLSLDIFTPSN